MRLQGNFFRERFHKVSLLAENQKENLRYCLSLPRVAPFCLWINKEK